MQGIAKDSLKDKRHNHPPIDRDITPLPGEEWKDIAEWKGHLLQEGYQVSNLGRVRSLGRVVMQKHNNGTIGPHPYPPCMMRISVDEDGYLFVGLCRKDKGRPVTGRVHQLVATFFLPEGPKEGQTHVNHIDGDKTNNRPSNLEWATPEENNKHARETGLARPGTSQAIRCKIVETAEVLPSKSQANLIIGHRGGYIEYCVENNLPIIDRRTNSEIHLEFIYPEGGTNDEKR